MSPAAAFKQRLRAREALLGAFVKTPHPAVVEVLASSGLDCLCLDAEHAPFGRRELDSCLLAARAHGLPVLVRVPSGAPHEILNALDLGAAGIVAPHVRDGAHARAIAASCHYGAGGRGYAGGTRATNFQAQAIADRLASARAETSVIVQIEDVEALAHAAAIAGAEDVDAVFIGRVDLTVALGETDVKAARVMETVADLVKAITGAGAAAGMFCPDAGETPAWRAQGASFFLHGSDHGFLRAGAKLLRAEAKL